MSLMGKGEHLFVATAISEGFDFVLATNGILWDSIASWCLGCGKRLDDAVHLFLTIAVSGLEAPCQLSIYYFYLGTQDLDAFQIAYLKERAYPVVDAGADNEYFCPCNQCFMYQSNTFGTEQMLILFGKTTAERIKFLDAHAGEEVGEYLLFCLPVRIKVQLHQHQ